MKKKFYKVIVAILVLAMSVTTFVGCDDESMCNGYPAPIDNVYTDLAYVTIEGFEEEMKKRLEDDYFYDGVPSQYMSFVDLPETLELESAYFDSNGEMTLEYMKVGEFDSVVKLISTYKGELADESFESEKDKFCSLSSYENCGQYFSIVNDSGVGNGKTYYFITGHTLIELFIADEMEGTLKDIEIRPVLLERNPPQAIPTVCP